MMDRREEEEEDGEDKEDKEEKVGLVAFKVPALSLSRLAD